MLGGRSGSGAALGHGLGGLRILCCGGAPLLDPELRVADQSWWPGEEVADKDVLPERAGSPAPGVRPSPTLAFAGAPSRGAEAGRPTHSILPAQAHKCDLGVVGHP